MKKIIIHFFLLISLFFPITVFGAPDGGIGTVDPSNIGRDNSIVSSDPNSIANIFVGLVNWFAWFVALAAVIFGLYSGFLFITAAGDDSTIKKAKDVLIYTVIGIIVSILSFGIVSLAESLITVW